MNEATLRDLKKVLGRRRFRVALLRHGLGRRQRDIARTLRVSQATVSRDLKAVRRVVERMHAAVPT